MTKEKTKTITTDARLPASLMCQNVFGVVVVFQTGKATRVLSLGRGRKMSFEAIVSSFVSSSCSSRL